MKPTLFYTCLVSLFVIVLFSTNSFAQKSSNKPSSQKAQIYLAIYLDKDNDGNYEKTELAENEQPRPIQGQEKWIKDFFGAIRYPSEARANKIEGKVVLDVEVDENGEILFVGIKQSLTRECNEEARKGYIQATKKGYFPLIINGTPTKFKMDIPISFFLGE